MTPFEHYQEAQHCIEMAKGSQMSGDSTYFIAEAQVHATLAQCGDLSGAWEQ